MRVYQCDGCSGLIEWKEGQKGGDAPPITVRGQGLVLDFCSTACMGEWGLQDSLKQRQDAMKETKRAQKKAT